jgi:hypothetical protein
VRRSTEGSLHTKLIPSLTGWAPEYQERPLAPVGSALGWYWAEGSEVLSSTKHDQDRNRRKATLHKPQDLVYH